MSQLDRDALRAVLAGQLLNPDPLADVIATIAGRDGGGGGGGSVPIATTSAPGIVQPDGTSVTISVSGILHATPPAPPANATTGAPGIVRPDGTTITVNGAGVISAVAGTGALPAANAVTAPAWSTYTTHVQGVSINMGGYPLSATFGGANYAITEVLAVMLDIPAGAIGAPSFAVAGYARSASSTGTAHSGAGGLYGQGAMNGDNVPTWGLNTVNSNSGGASAAPGTGHTGVNGYGYEINMNIASLAGGGNPTGFYYGIYMTGAGDAKPTGGMRAIVIDAPGRYASPVVQWDDVLHINDGSSAAGIYLGATGVTANSASVGITFGSRNNSNAPVQSAMYGDTSGNIILAPAGGFVAIGANAVLTNAQVNPAGATTGQALVANSSGVFVPGTVSGGGTYTLPAATGSALGGVKSSATIAIAGDGTATLAQNGATSGQVPQWNGTSWIAATVTSGGTTYTLPAATGSVLGGIKVGTGLTVAGDGTLNAQALPFSRTAYTAAGAIALTDTLSILNNTTAVAMTLANGTTDGQTTLIVLMGTANATVTGNFDGSSGTAITLTASAAGTVRDKIRPKWSVADSTWFVE